MEIMHTKSTCRGPWDDLVHGGLATIANRGARRSSTYGRSGAWTPPWQREKGEEEVTWSLIVAGVGWRDGKVRPMENSNGGGGWCFDDATLVARRR
jgi:hypothetical protein